MPLNEDQAVWSRLGLGHIALRVDDLDAAMERVRRAGGGILEASLMQHSERGARVVFATDPDGTRVELIQSPGDPSVPPGDPIRTEDA